MFEKMFLTKVVVVLAFLSCISGDPCEHVTCPNTPKHYWELGCTPVKGAGDCCAKSYECPDFKALDVNKCHFKGQEYDIGQEISDAIHTSECETSCNCQPGYPAGRPAHFECADIECADLFDDSLRNCVHQYKSGECCPDYKCTEDEVKNLGFCVLEGRTYRTGASMYPSSLPCHTCNCTENFDNSTLLGNEACTETNCHYELRNIYKFQMECVPIYYKTDVCCPIEFRCPNQQDVIKTNEVGPKSESHVHCKYGDLKLNVGEEIETNDPCLTCKCSTPPFVHCIKAPKCHRGRFD